MIKSGLAVAFSSHDRRPPISKPWDLQGWSWQLALEALDLLELALA